MRRWLWAWLLVGLCSLARGEPAGVAAWTDEWRDEVRQRVVPVKVYEPGGEGPWPVIVFSHGLGGSREMYGYLGRGWAVQGYVVVMLQHPGSDESVWRGVPPRERLVAMRRAVADPANLVNRPRDVTLAIDTLTRLQADGPRLRGKLDLERVGVAGHSFGAYTTLAVAGQTFATRLGGVSLGDGRVKAAVAMSAPVPGEADRYAQSYGSIRIPVLHMTGTRDDSAIGDTPAAKRRVPFDHHPGGKGREQYLVILDGGDHMVFPGRPRRLAVPTDDLHHRLIVEITSQFWQAHLRGDEDAARWLQGEGMRRLAGDAATVEVKR